MASGAIQTRTAPVVRRAQAESHYTDDYTWVATAVQVAVPAAFFVLAVALRFPNLMEVPGFTDETIDVRVALDAVDGKWPLVDAEPYIGALFNYVLAAGFLIFGQNAYVPRLMVTLLGAGTVALTYLLARRIAGTPAALITAGLLATSGVHIVNGHIAWSNCTTPFFTTAALLALVQAVSRGSGRLLVLAGALYGLALQTHASVAFLAPALVIYVVTAWPFPQRGLRGRLSLLSTPWPYLTILVVGVAMSNILVHNVSNPGGWGTAVNRQSAYAYVDNPTTESYAQNMQAIGGTLIRLVSSTFTGEPGISSQLTNPVSLLYLGILLVGLGYALWRRHFLPVVAILVTALLMPYLNKNYEFPIGVRYLGFLVPLLYLLIAMPLAAALESLWRRARPAAVLVGILSLTLMVIPLVNLSSYYDTFLRSSPTNPTILAVQSEVRARYQAGMISEVILDPQLDWIYTAPGGRALRAFDMLFAIERVPHRTVWMVPEFVIRETATANKPVILIMSQESRDRLGSSVRLTRLEVPDRPQLRRDGYWAYVLTRT